MSWGEGRGQNHHELVGEAKRLQYYPVAAFGHIGIDEIRSKKVNNLRVHETSPREELELDKHKAGLFALVVGGHVVHRGVVCAPILIVGFDTDSLFVKLLCDRWSGCVPSVKVFFDPKCLLGKDNVLLFGKEKPFGIISSREGQFV